MVMQNQPRVVMFDVDGTITQEGEYNPKAQAIGKLEQGLQEAAILSNDTAWKEFRQDIIRDPQYYRRFYSSYEEVCQAPENGQSLVLYEGIKDKLPHASKLLNDIMVAGLEKRELSVVPHDDVVSAILELAGEGVKIATYSGGSNLVQQLMLAQIPVNRNILGEQYLDLSQVIRWPGTGKGMHSKKDFGSKTKTESYENAQRHFSEQNCVLAAYITDSVGEAKACASTGTTTVYINRSVAEVDKEKLRNEGICVVSNGDELLDVIKNV